VDEKRIELSYKKGELLCKQGMPVSHVMYIRKGFVKLFLEDDDITILGIARPFTFIGVQSLYGAQTYPFSAEALTNVEVCLEDISVFRNLVLENPEFARRVIEILNAELVQSYKRMFSLSTKHLDQRFSELLLFMCNVLYESNPFRLKVSRKEIASLISASPESVSRLIHEFKAKGIIRNKGRTIEIVNVDQLMQTCSSESLPVR